MRQVTIASENAQSTSAKINNSNLQTSRQAANLLSQQETSLETKISLSKRRNSETSFSGPYALNYKGMKDGSASSQPVYTGADSVSIIIHDIDELANSISVSTSLNEQSNEINEETLISGGEDLANARLNIQTIDMTNQNGSRINPSTSGVISTPL